MKKTLKSKRKPVANKDDEFYNRSIRKLLDDICIGMHSPESIIKSVIQKGLSWN